MNVPSRTNAHFKKGGKWCSGGGLYWSLKCPRQVPPDFYPAYRRVKAGENGRGLAYTGLYAPIRGVKIRWRFREYQKKRKVGKMNLSLP